MRIGRSLMVIFGICLIFASANRAEEPAAAREIISRAIEVLADETKLARFNAATWKSRGTITIGSTARAFTSEWAIHSQWQYRKAKAYPADDSKSVLVLNRDQAWFLSNRGLISFRTKQLAPVRAEHYTHWVALRLDVVDTAQLSMLGESQLDKRTVVGVKVRDKDVPDLDLYFDKATMLLARSDTYLTTQDGPKSAETRLFRNYKETDGIKYASVVHWTGKNGDELAVQEEERFDFAIHERLEQAVFAKPD